jgi:hypothetical protein
MEIIKRIREKLDFILPKDNLYTTRDTKIFKNPAVSEVFKIIKDTGLIRFLINLDTRDVYMWNPRTAIHVAVVRYLKTEDLIKNYVSGLYSTTKTFISDTGQNTVIGEDNIKKEILNSGFIGLINPVLNQLELYYRSLSPVYDNKLTIETNDDIRWEFLRGYEFKKENKTLDKH